MAVIIQNSIHNVRQKFIKVSFLSSGKADQLETRITPKKQERKYIYSICLFFFGRLLLPFRLHIFSHTVYFPAIYVFFSSTICLSPDCSDDVDMTVRPPKRIAPATVETNQSFLEDGAVTSFYHQTNNLGSLSFIFLCIFILFYFFFAFLVKHIYTTQNNQISQFSKFTVCTT